jgi:hypothetical protein
VVKNGVSIYPILVLLNRKPLEMSHYIRSIKKSLLFFLVVIASGSCSVVQQGQQMAALAKCEFRIQSVTNLRLNDVNVEDIKSISDLTIMDAQQLIRGVSGKTFPLNFILSVQARNPNSSVAGMNQLAWILFIDDIQMTSGSVNQPVTIPGNNGSAVIPVQMNLDLKKILNGKSGDAIVNFGFNLAGTGTKPTRFTIKLKPTIMIGNNAVVYPGYITVKTEYVSQ